ncbi:MAG: fumarate hydratase [Cellvibrionaceae bacterium]|nr:fumarate hydratase [Cellvibrionaceae bacterium]
MDAVYAAYQREANPAAKDAMAQILINSRMCAEGQRPICQDTGIVTVFAEVGMDARIEGTMSPDDMINEGVRRAYRNVDNVLRASILADPDGARKNTGDNTPAVIHYKIVPGNTIDVHVAAKGGGSEAKSKFAMLNPSDSVVDWVLERGAANGRRLVPAGVCSASALAARRKKPCCWPKKRCSILSIFKSCERGPSNRAETLRLELYDKVNALGIGAQGLGGLTTVLDAKVKDFPQLTRRTKP